MPMSEPVPGRSRTIHAAVISLEERAKDLSLEQILRATLDEAEALTGSHIGFYHFVEEDQENLLLQAWSTRTEAEFCTAEGKGMHYPVSKAGVWADCLRVGHPLIQNDYQNVPNRKGLPPGHATVLRELVVPVKRSGRVVAVLGVGNKLADYDEADIESVQLLADLAWHLAASKRMTLELENSLAKNQALIQAIPDLIFTNKRDGEYLDVHVSDANLLYATPDVFLHRKVQDVLPEPLGEQFLNAFEEVLDSSSLRELTYSLQVGSVEKCFEARLVPCSPDRVITIVRDITSQKEAQEALEASEALFRDLLERQGEGFGMVDGEERFLYANPVAETIFGVPPGGLLGRSLLEFVPDKGHGQIKEGTLERMAGRSSTYEMAIRRPNGETKTILVTATPRFHRDGGALQVIGVFRDITEEKLAEQKLRQEKERLSQIFQGSYDAIFVTDLVTGTYLDVNQAFERITGYSREEAIGRNSVDLNLWFRKEDRGNYYQDLHATGAVHNRLIHIRHREGREVIAECNSTVMEFNGRKCMVSLARDVTEREAARAALETSEANLTSLFASTEDLIWSVDLDHRVVAFNPALNAHFQNNWGIELRVGSRADEHLPPDRASFWGPLYERAIAEGPFHLETTLQGGRCLDFCFNPVRRGQSIVGVSVFGRDMTERRAAEKALAVSEARLHAIWDAEPECVKLLSPEGLLLDMNKAGIEMLEVDSREQVIGKPVIEMVVQEHHSRFLEIARQAFKEGSGFGEFEMVGQRGTRRWMESHAVPLWDEASESNLLLAVTRDITDRKKAEAALKESMKRYQTLFDNASEGILVHSVDGQALEVNEAFAQMHGYTRQEMMQINLKDLNAPGSFRKHPDRLGRILAGEVLTFEVEHVHKNGHSFPLEVLTSLITPGENPVLLAFHRDISKRKRDEEDKLKLLSQLQQSQKMESLGVLAGGVAHDMNNVLGAILGLASTNLEIQPPGSPYYRSFETIVKAATRGGEMVRNLLSFARQGKAEEQVLDLNAILVDEIKLLERTVLSKVHLELELESGLSPMLGDPSALVSAFMNLCVNAVDAMPENGTLTMRSRNVNRDWIEVAIEDTGTGMPREVLEKAMEPFFTTKEVGKGTGLGLSMVYSTVKAHRGEIEIQSVQGQGTTVRMRFPVCARETAGLEAETGPLAEATGKSMSVLLIDDDDLIQSSMDAMLQTLGHAVSAASSGEEALARIEAGFRPDVVILDMNMPGLGGIGTLPRLRALLPTVPVLLSTGRTDQAALDLSQAHPFVTLLPKPFSMKEVRGRLASIKLG